VVLAGHVSGGRAYALKVEIGELADLAAVRLSVEGPKRCFGLDLPAEDGLEDRLFEVVVGGRWMQASIVQAADQIREAQALRLVRAAALVDPGQGVLVALQPRTQSGGDHLDIERAQPISRQRRLRAGAQLNQKRAEVRNPAVPDLCGSLRPCGGSGPVCDPRSQTADVGVRSDPSRDRLQASPVRLRPLPQWAKGRLPVRLGRRQQGESGTSPRQIFKRRQPRRQAGRDIDSNPRVARVRFCDRRQRAMRRGQVGCFVTRSSRAKSAWMCWSANRPRL